MVWLLLVTMVSLCFLPGGQRQNNQTISYIYTSHLTEKGWTEPVRAPEPLNQEGSNSAQPYLTTDGRYVLFSSDRPGGAGGYDLWKASLDSNHEVIQVQNLGNVINTSGDEEAPYFHEKSGTLVFSSDGHVGMGGFDIFYARGNFNSERLGKTSECRSSFEFIER